MSRRALIVPMIGTGQMGGTAADPYRPDLPATADYVVEGTSATSFRVRVTADDATMALILATPGVEAVD